MEIRSFRYNPALWSDDELLDIFCVRENEYEILKRCIKENTGEVNQHLLLIGIRGSGKTTLLRRIAVEIKRDDELSSKWYPVVFSEENHEILSLDDFWLQSLYYLDKTGYEELKRRGARDPYSEDIGLSRILDFADAHNKRLLLICENLQDMLSVLPEVDAWRLRKVLQADCRIMLLGSATARFDQIEKYKQPFYEFFKVVTLKRMSQSDCQKLWAKVTGNSISEVQARALQILTGGLLRLLTIVASFSKHLSFAQLIREFEELIDDHTEYFKRSMEDLPPKERKVFATLARLWKPSASSEIAFEARMEQTETSSLINRLVNRGAVEEYSDGVKKKRAKQYQLTGRLFNIYYLMRIGGEYSTWVKPVVEFLAQVYDVKLTDELDNIDMTQCDAITMKQIQILKSIAFSDSSASLDESIISVADEKSADIQKFIDEIRELEEKGKLTEESLSKVLQTFGKTVAVLGEYHPGAAATYSNMAKECYYLGYYDKALSLYEKALTIREKTLGKEHPDTANTYNNMANVYYNHGDYDKAISLHEKALAIREKALGKEHPYAANTYNNMANVYYKQGNYDKALSLYQKALYIYEKALGKDHLDTADTYNNMANVYPHQGDYDKALLWYQKALDIYVKALGKDHPDTADIYNNMANVYSYQGDYDKALSWLQKALIIKEKALGKNQPDIANTYGNMANVYSYQEDYDKALLWYQKALDIFEKSLGKNHPDIARTYYNMSIIFYKKGEHKKAFECLARVLDSPDLVSGDIKNINNFCMNIAALSNEMAHKIIELIEYSPSREALSPLITGLRGYLGIEFSAPLEVREIADDIKTWIKERSKRNRLNSYK